MRKFSYHFILLHIGIKFYLAFVLLNHEQKTLISKCILILQLLKDNNSFSVKEFSFVPLLLSGSLSQVLFWLYRKLHLRLPSIYSTEQQFCVNNLQRLIIKSNLDGS